MRYLENIQTNDGGIVMKMWIARTPLGTLSLHNIYPEYITDENDSCWINGHVLYLDDCLFPEVTFENSPKEVELKLIEKTEEQI